MKKKSITYSRIIRGAIRYYLHHKDISYNCGICKSLLQQATAISDTMSENKDNRYFDRVYEAMMKVCKEFHTTYWSCDLQHSHQPFWFGDPNDKNAQEHRVMAMFFVLELCKNKRVYVEID